MPNIPDGPNRTRNRLALKTFLCRTTTFKGSFFPYCTDQWNRLDPVIQNSISLNVFKNHLLRFIRPSPNSLYRVFDPSSSFLLSRLRLGLSHLRDHKFRHNFKDTVNPLCDCSLETEDTSHYLLRCHFFSKQRTDLFDGINTINSDILKKDQSLIVNILMYGDMKLSDEKNTNILTYVIKFIKATKRFEGKLF